MVCAQKCIGLNNIHFSYIELTHGTQDNSLEYISISSCSNVTVGYYPIYLKSGNQKLNYVNSSNNKANSGSSLRISYPFYFTSNFCNFVNNIAFVYAIIYSESNSGTISYANVINNNCPSFGVYVQEEVLLK